jgi:hypothetical protein
VRGYRGPLSARLWARVVATPNGCWIFTGALNAGYGRIHAGHPGSQRLLYVHRVAYEQLVGPIPEGLDLDHLCRNRACCNPAHLEPVTRRENLLRGESTLAAAHHEGRDCGFDGCKVCRRFRVAALVGAAS